MAFLRSAAVVQIVLVAAAATCVGQICVPHWSDKFPAGDFDDVVRTAIEWDEDGEGPLPPALYVGGDFTVAGGVPARIWRSGMEMRGRKSAAEPAYRRS